MLHSVPTDPHAPVITPMRCRFALSNPKRKAPIMSSDLRRRKYRNQRQRKGLLDQKDNFSLMTTRPKTNHLFHQTQTHQEMNQANRIRITVHNTKTKAHLIRARPNVPSGTNHHRISAKNTHSSSHITTDRSTNST